MLVGDIGEAGNRGKRSARGKGRGGLDQTEVLL